MAYGVIQFVEAGKRIATLVRTDGGEPTGEFGVMNMLAAFIEETAPRMLRQGSPGALYMAELFTAREVQAGRPIRVLGGQGELGISVDEVQALTGRGYFYDINIGPEGDRSPPTLHMTPLSEPPRKV
jgi:hypothetical protein